MRAVVVGYMCLLPMSGLGEVGVASDRPDIGTLQVSGQPSGRFGPYRLGPLLASQGLYRIVPSDHVSRRGPLVLRGQSNPFFRYMIDEAEASISPQSIAVSAADGVPLERESRPKHLCMLQYCSSVPTAPSFGVTYPADWRVSGTSYSCFFLLQWLA